MVSDPRMDKSKARWRLSPSEKYDVATQIAVSHRYCVIDGQLKTFSSPHRYVWPSELDLMARLAGMTLLER